MEELTLTDKQAITLFTSIMDNMSRELDNIDKGVIEDPIEKRVAVEAHLKCLTSTLSALSGLKNMYTQKSPVSQATILVADALIQTTKETQDEEKEGK